MRNLYWCPSIELSQPETQIIKSIRKSKFFLFLRMERHRIVDLDFQSELISIYGEKAKGKAAIPPAQLALAILLQAYTGISDEEVIEAMMMDLRWQLVLDCLEAKEALFGKTTLVRFRAALKKYQLDRKLIEKTVQAAKASQLFGARQLQGTLDASALWGAKQVEVVNHNFLQRKIVYYAAYGAMILGSMGLTGCLNNVAASHSTLMLGRQVRVIRVSDGDTLQVMDNGKRTSIRFACIDADEVRHGRTPAQPFGEASKAYLRRLVDEAGGKVHIVDSGARTYGRVVAQVYTVVNNQTKFVQEEQTKLGLAWPYARYRNNCPNWPLIENAARIARTNRVGIWSLANPEAPWDFRNRMRSQRRQRN